MEEIRNDEMTSIPYVVYESAQTRMERVNKRLIVALVLSIILIFASNAIWLWAWTSYDYTSEEATTTYQQDGGGLNNINTGSQGDLSDGAEINDNEAQENPEKEER